MEGHQSNINPLIEIKDENSSTTEQSVSADYDPINDMEFECVSSLL